MRTDMNAIGLASVSGIQAPKKVLVWYSILLLVSAGFVLLEPTLRPLAQLLLVVPLIIVLWSTSVQGMRVPRVVFVVAVLAFSIGAALQFSTVHLRHGAFAVATVSKGELWQETRIYRDRLNRALGSDGRALAGLHRGVIDSQAAAEAVLKERPSLGGIIWGDTRWMTISFRHIAGLSMRSFDQSSFARRWLQSHNWQDLYVVRSIPSIGLSHGHQDATVHFIARLIRVSNGFERKTTSGARDQEFELEVADLARTNARWSARTHQAYVLWMEGTYHLVRAIEGNSLSREDLQRALSEFADALGQFRQGDNPALYAAIQNNFALTMLVDADFSEKQEKIRHHALKRMMVAQKISFFRAPNKEIVLNGMTLGVSQGGGAS